MKQNENELIDISKLFGENLRKLRKNANLTQDELSEKLDISQKHLSKIETGNQFASAQLISKIANVLENTLHNILKRSINKVLNENNFPKQLANNIISRITTNLINETNKQNNILYERLHQEIEQLKDSDKKQNDIFGFPIL